MIDHMTSVCTCICVQVRVFVCGWCCEWLWFECTHTWCAVRQMYMFSHSVWFNTCSNNHQKGIFLMLIHVAVKCNTLYQKNYLLWHNQPPMMEWQKIKIPSSRQTITKYNMREPTSPQPTPSLLHQAIRLYFSNIVAWIRLTTQNRRSADFSKNL